MSSPSNLRHGVDLDALKAAHAAYLASRKGYNAANDTERFFTSRIFAELELRGFVDWLDARAEPSARDQESSHPGLSLSAAVATPSSSAVPPPLDGVLRALCACAEATSGEPRRALTSAIGDLLVCMHADGACEPATQGEVRLAAR